MALVICPNQLFEHEPLKVVQKHGLKEIIVWEDPVFFGDRRGSPHGNARLRLNKMRIIYMRVATRWYVGYLRAHVPSSVSVVHVPVEELWDVPWKQRYVSWENKSIWMFDPADHLFMKRIHTYHPTILDSPQFLLTSADIQEYSASRAGNKRLQHAHFFAFVKSKLKLHRLTNVGSTDAMNRRPFPKRGALPSLPSVNVATNSDREAEWARQVEWLESHHVFRKNPGSTQDVGYPFTFQDVHAWFHKFLKERFALFGTYEDAVVAESPWLYHSGIAVFLNMGLITPTWVMETLHRPQYRHLVQELNNYEGFLRQLMGWREYSRLYYTMVPPSVYRKNIFGMKKQRRLPSAWYATTHSTKLTTGIGFVDRTVEDAWNIGYLHHIQRLMVISNYMVLDGVHPDRVFDWMYEFSMDSWDWVMVFNVYAMGTWSDGGYAMRKPYISSASYLQRMARMEDPHDSYIWDEKFKNFLKQHKDILKHTQLAKLVRSL
jgi:deoxyribodipyrimidine photolyase-related protein